MNHSKLILVACISAFVAITTAVLGVAGTIIGSVLSSVLYNLLSEVLEKPVQNAKFSTNFEWEIAYVFPLVVILIIQLLLILAFLSEWGLLPSIFLQMYLSIQGIADNNLYRVLGFSLIVMSVYPFILKPDIVKKEHGLIIAVIGVIFLARGFADFGTKVSFAYGMIFRYFDFPIALIAFLLLIFVINKIVSSARESQKDFITVKHGVTNHNKNKQNFDDLKLKEVKPRNHKVINKTNAPQFKRHIDEYSQTKINESVKDIQFESNDLLDDYKK